MKFSDFGEILRLHFTIVAIHNMTHTFAETRTNTNFMNFEKIIEIEFLNSTSLDSFQKIFSIY